MINVSLINTAEQCQAQIAEITTEAARLDVRKRGLERAIASNETDALELPGEIQALENQLVILNNAVALVPEGSAKNDLLDQISDVEIDLIQTRAELREIGPSAKALRMLNLNLALKSIEVNEAYKAQLDARLLELGTSS